MKLYTQIIEAINEFTPEDPLIQESQLEIKLRTFLEQKDIIVSRQVTKKKDRYDLICRKENEQVCIELKLKTNISDIKQFDRYLPKFKDGFIVVCWQATTSVRDIFNNVKDQSPIPIALIELSKKYSLA